jgi:predicted PurR-regulated permease PerM
MEQHPDLRLLPADGQRIEARVTDFIVRLAFLGLFAYWSLELVRPFLPIVVWAVLLTVALYPVYDWIGRKLGGRRVIASLIVTGLVLVTVLGPVSVLATSLAETVQWLAAGLQAGTVQVPPPPPQVETWPFVGEPLHDAWALAATNLEGALHQYGPVVLPAGGSVIATVAALGADVLKFVASVVIAGFLFAPGPKLAAGARQFVTRIVQPRGGHFVDLAGATIRNVSRGVIGVALLQTLLVGIILQIAGLPGAGLIAFAVLVFCIVQIGPAPVLLPVLIWVWLTMSTGAALVLTLVLVPVLVIDNVLKPMLMARGLTTPMLVILAGVIGGTITYGLIGLFLGPIVLAVFYELVVAWVRLEPADVREAGAAE